MLDNVRHRSLGLRRSLSLTLVFALFLTVLAPSRVVDATDSVTMAEVREIVGASALVRDGITGAGVDVALIDTGVEAVIGLDGTDKVIVGPDFSFEAGVPELYGRDTYGHGTVMASIIAGTDGMAPGARIVSVKVADNTGAVDVSQVIAALDWVTANGRTNGLNVRVINLSYVTDSKQSYEIDPLAYAVERAWQAGYVVVVAAGNAGNKTNELGNPAADPYVIAVAAADETGAAEFSNRGSGTRVPDVLAPGHQILGLASPNSRLVQDHPEALIDGRYLRGSGTSQATAIVSGAAALLLEQRPDLTPDQVKALLIMGTVDMDGLGSGGKVAPIEGLSEFFDLLDAESAFLAEERALRSQAAALRAEADADMGDAAVLLTEAAAAQSSADELFAEADELSEAARRYSGNTKKELRNEAKAIENEAKLFEATADDLTKQAGELIKSSEGSVDFAAKLDRDADDAAAKAIQAREDAEKAVVPDYVKEAEWADRYRAEAIVLRAEADRLTQEAAPLFDEAASLFSEALRYREEAEALEVEIQANLSEAQSLLDRADQLVQQAVASSERDASTLEDEASELRTKAESLKAIGSALEEDASAIEKIANAIEAEARDIQRAAADLQKRAFEADRDASQLEHDAAAADSRSLVDYARLEAQIADLFTDWDGRSLGALRYDKHSGAGLIDIERSAAVPTFDAVQSHPRSTGTGSLEDARGTNHVVLPDGSELTGEVTFTGSTWSGSTWSGSTWSGSTWSGSTWSGSTWSGSTWSGSTWSGSTWSGSTWSGSTWSGSTWSGSTWSGSTWSGSTWSGSTWSGSTWSGSTWSGSTWS